jgi:hypothetical protein
MCRGAIQTVRPKETEPMKRATTVLSLCMFLLPVASHAEGLPPVAKPCDKDPVGLACIEYHAQKSQADVSKIFGDLTAGRPPALPGLDKLPSLDLGKLLPKP